jgi:apolipoprotein N-acyltransferase
MNRLDKAGVLACMGALCFWLSLPPMKQPWAAYLAAAFGVAAIAKRCPLTRRDYVMVWLAGFAMWLALLQGIRLAFWPLYGGWIALSFYLAFYLPMFIAAARSLHIRFRFPLALASAITWVGFEWIRAYFATGFAACMLGHSQTPWPWMLPIASHFGAYGVSFIVMFSGATLYQCYQLAALYRTSVRPDNTASNPKGLSDAKFRVTSIAVQLTIVLAMIAASVWSLRSHDQWLQEQSPIKPLARVLLIQDNMPTMFDADLNDIKVGWQRYEQQTAIAAGVAGDRVVDLVVWPESTFGGGVPWLDWDKSNKPSSDFDGDSVEFSQRLKSVESSMDIKLKLLYAPFKSSKPQFLLGTDVLKVRSGEMSMYNTALWVPSESTADAEYYAKRHLVMFGEYIPVLSSFPSVLKSIGMGQLDSGRESKAWKLPSGAIFSASVCFENVIPHLLYSQIRELNKQGVAPDLLVNVTNDGWFRGSTILDHHLNNAILAAVENRRPMLVAANLGISAWIDGDGRLVRALPRVEPGFIIAEPIPDGRWGLWQSIGDLPAMILAIITLLPFAFYVFQKAISKRKSSNGRQETSLQ